MIISVSLNDSTLKAIDDLKNQGYSGRSEIIRAAVRSLLENNKEKEKLKGTIEAILIIIHNEENTESISLISHKFQELIKTQLHNHNEQHICTELFILKGDSSKIKKMAESFETYKKIKQVKLIII